MRVFDPVSLRAAFSTFPSGVTSICAVRDGSPIGMAASSFVSVSLDPPLVSVCVQRTSATWPVLAKCRRIGVSVLSSSQGDICRKLASRIEERLCGVPHSVTEQGAVLIEGAASWLECSVHQVFEAGDHDVVLLRVQDFQINAGVPPLVFHASGFHSLAELVH
jgi:flavin reductase (DIM6/NTAB) family NADH-FMN oxidoreductase RutF